MLRQHIDFLIDRHSHFSSSDAKPILPEDPFSIEWTREALRVVVAHGINHITQVGLSRISLFFGIYQICQGYLLWDALRDWELENLSAVLSDERWVFRSRFPFAQRQELLWQIRSHRGNRRHVSRASPTVPFQWVLLSYVNVFFS